MRIDDLALLSDCRTAALEDRAGAIQWYCPGRFDAPSVFGQLLDDNAGHWTIRPRSPGRIERRYLDGGPILETTFTTDNGQATLTDALALRPALRAHEIQGGEVTHLVRYAACVRGEVELEVELVPRPEYGLVRPHFVPADGGWEVVGGPSTLNLMVSTPHQVANDSLRATVRLSAGESASWVLASGPHDGRTAEAAITDTREGWRSWAASHAEIPGRYGSVMRRSAMVLQALTHAPNGVVVAAPTTSLPERVGEEWNWDYRYAWLRDLSFVVRALWVAACPDEPRRYLDWIVRALGKLDGDHVQIMFGVDGRRDLTEHTLPHLAGFRDSRPVRIGNDAWRQSQLDVLGEVLDSAHLMRERLPGRIDGPLREMLIGLADMAANRWREPDFGMWEAQDRKRHYLSSKVMCWVALDRAVRLADRLHAGDRVASWASGRDAVQRAVLEEGWNPDVGAYTGAIGSDELDASVMLMPLVGMVPGDHERMRATTQRIEERLSTEIGVQRWADEGSGFLLCGFWLAECLALSGQQERAEDRFNATAAGANDLGLMAEEVSLRTGEPLGNFPQALSHVGLINAAQRLTDTAKGPSSP